MGKFIKFGKKIAGWIPESIGWDLGKKLWK